MAIELGVVMDPIDSINYKKDSTLAMLLAAQQRGWTINYMEQHDLFLDAGVAMARMRKLKVFADPECWYELEEVQDKPLSALQVILMRKDPPFDNEFLYTTHLLERAEKNGVLVVNRPQSLRDFNEKLFATQFPQCCPPLLVSRDIKRLKNFQTMQGDVIFKPLDGMGGMSIFRVQPNDPNINVILETLTEHGKRQIMAQKFIPEIVDGDKRILMIDGQPVPYALARIPLAGEKRGNLAAGGKGQARPLSERDRWICEQVAPTLKAAGLIFV
ncbi:MAG: glutathione synthase, partial [Pseudomonadales bacterium]|nr:glutathione synthase [Pseudomonadales bacterium]